jgi:hypothetical protein
VLPVSQAAVLMPVPMLGVEMPPCVLLCVAGGQAADAPWLSAGRRHHGAKARGGDGFGPRRYFPGVRSISPARPSRGRIHIPHQNADSPAAAMISNMAVAVRNGDGGTKVSDSQTNVGCYLIVHFE